MLKILASLLALVFSLVACGGSNSTAQSTPASPKSISIDGSWTMVDAQPDFIMKAEVANNTIDIYWHSNDTKALYWRGTVPAQIVEGQAFTSNGDVEELSRSMLGSQEKTKQFMYKNDRLSYDFGMMNVTKTIQMER